MTDQTTLDLALADRHDGQQANLAAATTGARDHRTVVETAVATLVRSGTVFTADNVHALVQHALGSQLYDANLVSSVMGIWAKDHRMVEVPRRTVTSERRTRHASRNRSWQRCPRRTTP